MNRPKYRHDFTLQYVCELLYQENLLTQEQTQFIHKRQTALAAEIRVSLARSGQGRKKSFYEVHPPEIIANARIPLQGKNERYLGEDQIMEVIAKSLDFPYQKLDPVKLDAEFSTHIISRAFASRHAILPLKAEGEELQVAMANPFDLEIVEHMQRITGQQINPVLTAKADILRIISDFYGFRSSINAAERDLNEDMDLGNLEQFVKLKRTDEIDASDSHVVNAVEYLLHYAFDQRASDIHIEPKRHFSLVRIRVDGILHPIYSLPRIVHKAVVSRIKTLSRLDIAEKRRPQDGRIKTSREGEEIELRVSTVPVAFGEKVVMRIFNPDILLQELLDLGFFSSEYFIYEKFISNPYGMILITGPTGSGKTTTLYSTLNTLATDEVNIVTLEDPIEMVYPQLNQIAVDTKINFTFAKTLRSVLRQDPDIVMVGEIRDGETAELAVQAALTGHLVLSTLHTNDASGAISRMLELGVKPYLLASCLIGVMAQRLVRKICCECEQELPISTSQLQALKLDPGKVDLQNQKIKKGVGCVHCRGTGYYGRDGVFEVLPISTEINGLIKGRANTGTILETARQEGVQSLRQRALQKMFNGITTCEEVLRVTRAD